MTGVRFAGGPAALRRAVSAFADAEISTEEAFRWGWLAQSAGRPGPAQHR